MNQARVERIPAFHAGSIKAAFIQDWGSYTNQTFVSVGMPINDTIRAMGRLNVSQPLINNFKRTMIQMRSDLLGVTWHNSGCTVLWLPDWKNDWEHWYTLIHETHHLVQHVLVTTNRMYDEADALAYQQEYLFRHIRERLQKLSKKRGRK
jgi:hypothetical protein